MTPRGLTPEELIRCAQEVQKRYPTARMSGNRVENLGIYYGGDEVSHYVEEFVGYIEMESPGEVHWIEESE